MAPRKVYTARAVPDLPQRLFNVTEELNFSTEEEFNRAWSVSDNCWAADGGKYEKVVDEKILKCQRYRCTLLRKGKESAKPRQLHSDISKRRNTYLPDSELCLCKMVVIKHPSGAMQVMPPPQCKDHSGNVHSHEIDRCDKIGVTRRSGVYSFTTRSLIKSAPTVSARL